MPRGVIQGPIEAAIPWVPSYRTCAQSCAEQVELGLSRDQEERLLQARATVLAEIGALAAERRRIGAALQVFALAYVQAVQGGHAR